MASLLANGGFFSSSVMESARDEMRKAVESNGADVKTFDLTLIFAMMDNISDNAPRIKAWCADLHTLVRNIKIFF